MNNNALTILAMLLSLCTGGVVILSASLYTFSSVVKKLWDRVYTLENKIESLQKAKQPKVGEK